MLFSSVPFLFYFLPAVLLVYFLVPKRAKNGVLLLSSLVFYGWGEPRYLPVMLVSILQGYIFGRLIERFRDTRRAKLFLVLSVLLSLGTLAYFKYADFMIANLNALTGLSAPLLRLALPVGISFYTFQILSYTVDVYRGTVPAQRNFIDLAAYIAMFPQLIAGPIVRYSDIAVQLKTREHSVSEAASGARRFILGLAKKILLANLLGELVSSFRASADLSVLYYWLGAIAFTLQIYYDFSGYSDMAIGLGRIFGFRFPENFQYPYLSGSITEFWRRWHISLGSWFRDYLYIPLGGSRRGKWRTVRNKLIVFFCTGLWHGAGWTFVIWGALHGAAHLVVELADIVHHKLVLPARCHGLQPFYQRGEQLVVRAADDDEDVVAVGLLEIAGVRVQLKALFLHDRHGLPSCLFADMRLIVEHARDRAERIPGESRQVLDRHQPFTAPAATPLIMCFWQQR